VFDIKKRAIFLFSYVALSIAVCAGVLLSTTQTVATDAVLASDTEEVLRGALEELGADIQLIDVSDSELGGKSVMIELRRKFDVDEVNRAVEGFVTLIDSLNDNKEVAISQYRLSVSDESEDLLVQLSADLIKRSFSWWQSPRLGVETWTGNTPIIPPSE
jgi:hypothetical protein